MHKAIVNTRAFQHAKELSRQQRVRDDLAEMTTGTARVLGGQIVWRRGLDTYRIEGSAGEHDTVSAVSVLTGAGNPLQAEN